MKKSLIQFMYGSNFYESDVGELSIHNRDVGWKLHTQLLANHHSYHFTVSYLLLAHTDFECFPASYATNSYIYVIATIFWRQKTTHSLLFSLLYNIIDISASEKIGCLKIGFFSMFIGSDVFLPTFKTCQLMFNMFYLFQYRRCIFFCLFLLASVNGVSKPTYHT